MSDLNGHSVAGKILWLIGSLNSRLCASPRSVLVDSILWDRPTLWPNAAERDYQDDSLAIILEAAARDKQDMYSM